ncbi:hypothetical protein Tco_0899598, partial [Tanacetum coccineum]
EGEGSGQPSKPQPPPSTAPPSQEGQVSTVAPSHPQKTQTPRQATRGRDTKIPQSSGPPEKVGDEVVHKELGDRVERAATTAASLDAEQDSGNILKTQSMAIPNVPLSQEIGTGGGPRCQKAMGGTIAQTRSERVPTSSYDSPLLRGNTLGSYEERLEQHELTDDVPPTPHDSPLSGGHTLGSDEGRLKQDKLTDIGRYGKNLETQEGFGDGQEVSTAAQVSTASTFVSTASPQRNADTTADDLTLAKTLMKIRKSAAKDKAQKLQEEFDAAERQRMAQVHQAAQGFTDAEWDDVLARVAADEDFVQQLQAGEKCSEEDLPMKLVELVNQRKKFFAQQRAEAKRNKPMTPAQQKDYMSNYIKNQEGGYSIKQLKSLSFEQVKDIFETTMRRVQSFVPMGSELEVQRLKRAGQEVLEKPVKRQKIGEASGSEAYQIFADMLKKFDRDDLVKLWDLVKERFSTTEPTDDKEKELWVELKRLFEPDNDDILWKLQRYMHDPLVWRLYDTCGVHHVSSVRGHDIFMLVEKEYPLTRGTLGLMMMARLLVEADSEMSRELLRKIFYQANRPR